MTGTMGPDLSDKSEGEVKNYIIPRLARGSHEGAEGVGCIMNLMCWVKSVPITNIDDEPEGWDANLRQLLIQINDNLCTHLTRDYNKQGELVELNCPSCSNLLLDWAFALSDSDWLEAKLSQPEYTEFLGLAQAVYQALEPYENSRYGGTYFDAESYDNDSSKYEQALPRDCYVLSDETREEEKLAYRKVKNRMEELLDCYSDKLRKYNILFPAAVSKFEEVPRIVKGNFVPEVAVEVPVKSDVSG